MLGATKQSRCVIAKINDKKISMQYIVYDLETTGLDYTKEQPIEIGIIKVDDNGQVEEHDIFVKTKEPLSEDTKRITNITDAMLAAQGIGLAEALEKAFAVLGIGRDGFDNNTIIIGHNILGFDNLFLQRFARELGYSFPLKKIFYDTAGEFRARLLGEKTYVYESKADFHERVLRLENKSVRYNLAAACAHYGIPMNETAHRANVDCRYTLKVFEKQNGLTLLKEDSLLIPAISPSQPIMPTIKNDANGGQGAFNF